MNLKSFKKIRLILINNIFFIKIIILTILLIFASAIEVLSIFILEPVFQFFSNNNHNFGDFYLYNLTNFNEYIDSIDFYFLYIIIIYLFKFLLMLLVLLYQANFIFDFKKYLSFKSADYFAKEKFEKQLLINSSQKVRVSVNEVQSFIDSVVIPFSTLFVEMFITISLILYAFSISPVFFLITLFFCSVIYLIFKKMRKIMPYLGKIRLKKDISRQVLIQQIFSSFREIKVLNKENEFLKKFYNLTSSSADAEKKFFLIDQYPRFILEFTVILIFSVIFILSDSLFKNDINYLLPKFGLYLIIFLRLLPSINRLNRSLNAIKYSDKLINVFFKIISESRKLDILEKKNKIKNYVNVKNFSNSIKLTNIVYRYKNKKIKFKKTINIYKGKSYLISGRSGVGKSTFLNILAGLVNPSEGKYFIDNKLLANPSRQLKLKIGYVLQSSYIYDDTIKENIIMFNKQKKNRNLFLTSTKITRMDEFVNILPNKYNSKIGEEGAKLSGGQKQRVLISRALFTNPDILIMDESTSNIDKKTEMKIYENIKKYKNKNLTVIVVSHNFIEKKYFDEVIKF